VMIGVGDGGGGNAEGTRDLDNGDRLITHEEGMLLS
jgi:hypothetical protein